MSRSVVEITMRACHYHTTRSSTRSARSLPAAPGPGKAARSPCTCTSRHPHTLQPTFLPPKFNVNINYMNSINIMFRGVYTV